MSSIVQNLWLVPALPILAGGVISVLKQRHRKLACSLAIGSMVIGFLISLAAFAHTLTASSEAKEVFNVGWFQLGDTWLKLGWMLDPMTAVMLVMVTFVGSLIFIYSVGYMNDDENFTRFFCFLALFAGAMLGVVISNSLLLLFMCWEIMGLTSYLLIGFFYFRPSAAKAAKKAFIVTRIGDLGFFLGMAWLYFRTGTLLFYDNGAGAIEPSALTAMLPHTAIFGLTVSSAIALLIFCGAAGKSGQFPLHTWLPDAMEGPTPVSALIHAATMVAAGVFLVARLYPLFSSTFIMMDISPIPSVAIQTVTWIGAITALFGSLVAVAQNDIKRILAYSTVSQLGYMMIGLGVGGPSVGMFHLVTHAFFKALLFLGAGSVIHGCAGEQDIRHMGGVSKYMRLTFLAYSAGMLALCGVPFFAGFWSKDEILHAAFSWSVSHIPFYMAALGALLTAFYMTRQMFYVFAGANRAKTQHDAHHEEPTSLALDHHHAPHESPAIMTTPLLILAAFACLLGFIGTPAFPWFQSFIEGEHATFSMAPFMQALPLMLASVTLVAISIATGYALYGRKPITDPHAPDALQKLQPQVFALLGNAFYINELYAATFVRASHLIAALADITDRYLFNGLVQLISYAVLALAWTDHATDTYLVNGAFNAGTGTVSLSGRILSHLQSGRVQRYLRFIGVALIVLVILMLWGAHA